MSQSRICIITTRNITDAPCLEKYREILTEPFDILYWDRCDVKEECGANNYFRFLGKMSVNAGVFQKIRNYIKFTRFISKHLKMHTYQKLIVFPTQAAWLVLKNLTHEYKGRYILDIRDYAGEARSILGRRTKKAVLCSGLCSITSEAYKKFLPKYDYVISHNIQQIDKELVDKYRSRQSGRDNPIVFSFIGTVRFIEQQKRLILAFQNDSRFELRFIGRGSEQLADFCKEHDIQNVKLIGRFNREDLPNFYIDADVAINVYGNRNPYLDYALSNKLYSAAIMGMPILVSPETYMAEIVEKYNIGYVVDYNVKNLKENIYKWFVDLDYTMLQLSCDKFMKAVYEDEVKYKNKIRDYLGN